MTNATPGLYKLTFLTKSTTCLARPEFSQRSYNSHSLSTETEVVVKTEIEPGGESEVDSKIVPQFKSEVELKVEPDVELEIESDVKLEVEIDVELQARSEVQFLVRDGRFIGIITKLYGSLLRLLSRPYFMGKLT